jgi:hypothetical protein
MYAIREWEIDMEIELRKAERSKPTNRGIIARLELAKGAYS